MDTIRYSTPRHTTQPLKPDGTEKMDVETFEPSDTSANTYRVGRIDRGAWRRCQLPRTPCSTWRSSLVKVREHQVPHLYLKVKRVIPPPICPNEWLLAARGVATYPSKWNQPTASCTALLAHRGLQLHAIFLGILLGVQGEERDAKVNESALSIRENQFKHWYFIM